MRPTSLQTVCQRAPVAKDTIKLPILQVNQITAHADVHQIGLIDFNSPLPKMISALLKHTVQHGWPQTITELPPELRPYWTFREEISIEDGILLKGERIIIPAVDQPDILGQEIPTRPWVKLATDIFTFNNQNYLLIVDYMSRFPVIRHLSNMTAKMVAEHTKAIFSELGIPKTLVSDNGPCYTGDQFKKTMSHLGITHITVRCNLAMHCSVTPFIIRQPIRRPRLLERVYKPMCTSH